MLRTLILTIFSLNAFSQPLSDPNTWRGVTDQVMGGLSDLIIQHEDGVFYMSGNVSTENNGGFVRLSNSIKLLSNEVQGIKFKAKGNNETYEIHVTLKGLKIPPWSYFSKSFEVNDGIDMFGVFERPLVKCHKNENLLIDYVRVIEYTKPGEQTQHVSKYSKLCFLPLYDPYSYDDDVDLFMNKYLLVEEKPPMEPEIVEKKVGIIEEKTVEVKVRKKKKVIEEIPDLKRAPLPKEKVEEKVFDEQAPQGIEWEVIHEHIREFQIGIAYRQYIEKVLKVEVELEGGGKKLETIKKCYYDYDKFKDEIFKFDTKRTYKSALTDKLMI